MPEKVEECVKSVLDDNPSYSESRAYAICNAKNNKGELGEFEDHDQLLEAYAESELDCPSGKVQAGQTCVDVEEVTDVPPSSLKHSVFQLADIETEPIERIEEGDNKIRFTNIKLLSPGVWTDSESRQRIWYSPRGMKNLEIKEDNSVNIMHDEENEVSEAGYIDPNSVERKEEGVFADIILETDNAAGKYADENLQKTLETEGAKGFGGPSVEIDAEGQEVQYNESKGVRELVKGIISGLGLVKNPASKPTSFARQVAQKGVALSEGSQSVLTLSDKSIRMDTQAKAQVLSEFDAKELQGPQEVEEEAQSIADELDVPIDEVLEVLDPLFDMDDDGDDDDNDDMDNADDDDDGGDDDGGDDDNPDDDDDDDNPDMDMEEKIQSLEERLTNLEDMAESMMQAEDVQEALEETKSDLADAETVKQLSEAKEDLEERLEDLEDRPDRKTLADNEEEEEIEGEVVFAGQYDDIRNSYSR